MIKTIVGHSYSIPAFDAKVNSLIKDGWKLKHFATHNTVLYAVMEKESENS
jgi:hypothetical protein